MCAGSWKASGREERPGSLKFHSRSGRIDQLARSFHHAPSLLCRSRESRYGARDRLNGSFQQRISIGSVSEGVAVTFVTRTGARAVFEKENKKIVDKSRYTDVDAIRRNVRCIFTSESRLRDKRSYYIYRLRATVVTLQKPRSNGVPFPPVFPTLRPYESLFLVVRHTYFFPTIVLGRGSRLFFDGSNR